MQRSLPIAVLLACAALAGCGSAPSPGEPLRLPSAPNEIALSKQSHFVLIVLENRELGEVVGSGSMPYLDSLERGGVLATDYHAITHPSLPNYIALLAGDPLGISSDCTGCEAHGTTLLDQLQAAHISWGAYMEGLPTPCWAGASSAGYAKKHDPFMYFARIASDPGRCRHVVPLSLLARDLRRDRLPAFAWISPNLCDDGHDCSDAMVDRFLRRLVPYVLAGIGPHGVLAIVWDEGTTESGCCQSAAGGRVPLILLGPTLRAGYRMSTPADHYSLLALMEDAFGVQRLRGAGCPCTPSLDSAFVSGVPPRLRGS